MGDFDTPFERVLLEVLIEPAEKFVQRFCGAIRVEEHEPVPSVDQCLWKR